MSKKHPTKKEIEEYNNVEKTCKKCGTKFHNSWSKWTLSEFCSQSCARSYSTFHKRDEINKKVSQTLQGISTTKGGKILVEDNMKKYYSSPKVCPICGKVIPYKRRADKTCSSKCGTLLRVQTNRERGTYTKVGGYREGSGRSKSGYYKGFFCGSTYELVYYIYCKDHNINIERNEKRFEYEHDGEKHTYLPDFRTDEGLVEIKGYHTSLVNVKMSVVDEPIRILYAKDIEYMMDYLDVTYNVHHNGKHNNYHTLYDDYKPMYEYTCSTCGNTFKRDVKLKTNHVFCSRSCCGKFNFK